MGVRLATALLDLPNSSGVHAKSYHYQCFHKEVLEQGSFPILSHFTRLLFHHFHHLFPNLAFFI